MTREEAKTEVENALKFIYTREHTAEVLEALSSEPQGDLISRKAVLELTKIISEDYSRERASFQYFIEKLPSAEPQGFEAYRKQYLFENVGPRQMSGVSGLTIMPILISLMPYF